ncbi:MAG: hypothetical protein NC938_01435 [Candidatus Omnitrophica bacterium]|nr:hypothetical protein [Candidatus Omnitrophota bacterium]
MIKGVALGEEIVIAAKNKIGLMADIAGMLANRGVNIESALGYEAGNTAKLMLVTNANLAIVSELKKKGYKSVKETEVVMVELENKPGALKVVTTELKKARIDIRYFYITSPSGVGGGRMVLQTSDNEKAMALLAKYAMSAQ